MSAEHTNDHIGGILTSPVCSYVSLMSTQNGPFRLPKMQFEVIRSFFSTSNSSLRSLLMLCLSPVHLDLESSKVCVKTLHSQHSEQGAKFVGLARVVDKL